MMIPAAHRLEGIQEYYFATKLRQIAQMQAQGRPVINLGIGSPDLPPPEAVRQSLARAALQEQGHGYQSYSGISALRQAWADFYQQHYQAELQPEGGILPLIGSKEGILHIAMAFLNPGDQALVPNPGYPTYSAATRLADATPIGYDLKEENDWQPDWEALEKTDLSAVRIFLKKPSLLAKNTVSWWSMTTPTALS
jgi:LL-diaminopimelate aminotransferase